MPRAGGRPDPVNRGTPRGEGRGRSVLPLVSVILPVRNEADFIESCLRSILDGEYPEGRIEILVVDGMSDDGTREIVESIQSHHLSVRMIDNPQRIVPTAMNRGILASSGEVIVRVDGHATVSEDFLSQSVQQLSEHPEAWCVGGAIETVNETWVGRTIAGAMSSAVGVGNATFRLGDSEGYVDTLAFGSYWRWVFDRIGMFDEQLVRNQDDELNWRIIQAGGKIYLSRAIRSKYYARTSLGKLWRQYRQYGFWRIRTMQKHRRPATLRQAAPLTFVLLWLVLLVSSVLWAPLGWVLLGFACLYALVLVLGGIDVGRRCGRSCGLLAPVVFAILHFGYGLGSLWGLVWFVFLRRGTAGLRGQGLSR